MASISVRVADLALRVATEAKSLRTLLNGNLPTLGELNTTGKGSLVAALNEVLALAQGAATNAASAARIDDTDGAATSSATAPSNARVRVLVSQAVAGVVNGSAAALDTLAELATAIGNDANFAATIMTALGNRLRLDTNQTLTTAQQIQGRNNLDVYSKAQIGDPDTDFVALFLAGLS